MSSDITYGYGNCLITKIVHKNKQASDFSHLVTQGPRCVIVAWLRCVIGSLRPVQFY